MPTIVKTFGSWLLQLLLEWGYKKALRALKDWKARSQVRKKEKKLNRKIKEQTEKAQTAKERDEAAKNLIDNF